ncbi:hypothetical protein F5Y18DRAFT_433893 [Xylariaceae sp. FL1019]|nr:hypothetical protein F5Y18DRAFT_433893 [Xylariaceae sp. FL1019]
MASRSRGHRLDLAGGEVVFCHACNNEWYRDDYGGSLTCPACQNEATEIVSEDNDPRPVSDESDSDHGYNHYHEHDHDHPFPRLDGHTHRHPYHHEHASDADPDEADIEEQLYNTPGGFFGRRTINRSPQTGGYGRPRPQSQSGDDIIRRFTEMIGTIGGPTTPGRPGVVGRSGPDTLFGHDNDGGPQVIARSYRTPGGGMASFTITNAPMRVTNSGPAGPRPAFGARGAEDPFQSLFSELFGQIGPPGFQQNHQQTRDPAGQGGGQDGEASNNGPGRPVDMVTLLNQLVASMINPHAAHGDAVYSQEALDRIITNLMEANPQSNAPAPAPQDAIASLPKKKLNESMLGDEGKGECTICIDDVKLGDEVIVLPCKHWFHEECASLWLKQHNSCPVCRAAIDGEAAGKPRNSGPTNNADQSSSSAAGPSNSAESSSGPEGRRSHLRHREARLDAIRNNAEGSRLSRFTDSADRTRRSRTSSPSSRSEQTRESRRGSNAGGGISGWIRDRFSGR